MLGKKSKKKDIKKRWKAKAIVVKRQKARKEISSFSKKENESDIRNNIDLNQTKDKDPLQL